MTMAAEIKNRMGPATSPGTDSFAQDFCKPFVNKYTMRVFLGQSSKVDITSKPVDQKSGGCC